MLKSAMGANERCETTGLGTAPQTERASRAGGLVRSLTLLAALALLFGLASAQRFDASTYHQQCLRFEAGGDLETARQSCLNALQLDPSYTDASIAVARIEVALGNNSAAELRLRDVRDDTTSAEPYLLLAEIALEEARLAEARSFLAAARARLDIQMNRTLDARRQHLSGILAERQGEWRTALEAYTAAGTTSPLEVEYRLATARLLLNMGEPQAARAELEDYQRLSRDTRNPNVLSALATASWSMNELDRAARLFEDAILLRPSRDREAQNADLHALTVVHYARGDFQSGSITLRNALRRGSLLPYLFASVLPWLLVLVALSAAHLLGESRVETKTTLEIVDGPEPWTLGDVYRIAIASWVLAGVATVAYSAVALSNALAIATPVQSGEARALFVGTLALGLVALSFWRVKSRGFVPGEALLGSPGAGASGVAVGLGLLGFVFALHAFGPAWPWLQGFFVDLPRLSPLVVAAVVALPLAELYFRSFVIPPLTRRYTATFAVVISGGLYALLLGAPVALLLVNGLALAELHRRTNSGLACVVAQFTFVFGATLAVSFSTWARGLFLL